MVIAAQAARLQTAEELPFWREAFAAAEWLTLRTSAVYYGFGVPRGDGSPVVLVPGLTESDLSLAELFYWLRRVGYQPHTSGFGVNFSCPDELMRTLITKIEAVHAETGRRVRLLGHSAGGTIARAAAVRKPKLVGQVITLGSPISEARVHPAILAAAELVTAGPNGSRAGTRCYFDACSCGFFTSVDKALPASIDRWSIYTKSDGVVDWHGCLDQDAAVNIEVSGTHAGLTLNAQVYRTVARLLAEVDA